MKYKFLDTAYMRGKRKTASGLGFERITVSPNQSCDNDVCEIEGCTEKPFIVVFHNQHTGLFVCKKHYAVCKMIDDPNITYNDYLDMLE